MLSLRHRDSREADVEAIALRNFSGPLESMIASFQSKKDTEYAHTGFQSCEAREKAGTCVASQSGRGFSAIPDRERFLMIPVTIDKFS
jgi:hypothetical protein